MQNPLPCCPFDSLGSTEGWPTKWSLVQTIHNPSPKRCCTSHTVLFGQNQKSFCRPEYLQDPWHHQCSPPSCTWIFSLQQSLEQGHFWYQVEELHHICRHCSDRQWSILEHLRRPACRHRTYRLWQLSHQVECGFEFSQPQHLCILDRKVWQPSSGSIGGCSGDCRSCPVAVDLLRLLTMTSC